jgi:hypothetical protein
MLLSLPLVSRFPILCGPLCVERHGFCSVPLVSGAGAAHTADCMRAGGGGGTIRLGPSRRALVSHVWCCWCLLFMFDVGGGFEFFVRCLFLPLLELGRSRGSLCTNNLVESKLADVCVSGIEATNVYCNVQKCCRSAGRSRIDESFFRFQVATIRVWTRVIDITAGAGRRAYLDCVH